MSIMYKVGFGILQNGKFILYSTVFKIIFIVI